jgi:serine/threonine-protein kinase
MDTALSQLDLTGKTLGDFHILRRLGEGGMGQVYLSEQRSLKRPIALKILKSDLAANPTALKRFKAEAEAVARATHTNIVQVYAIGEWDGLHYMALEYVDGLNLRDYLAKKGPPPLPLAISIMRQGAAALQRAGELGIIHRDIKPENILLTRKGAVKIADFGLSRCLDGDPKVVNLTQSGITMGTPLYMSPEQVEGKTLDPRTDIYSFGVTCYHMLAGHPPFQGQTAFEVALQHVQSDPEPLDKIRSDLPADLCGMVHKMMAKTPDARYQTARELLKDLARFREVLIGSQPTLGSITPISSPTISSLAATVKVETVSGRRFMVLAAVVVVALIGGAVAGFWNKSVATATVTLPALEQREKFLMGGVKEFANPRNWKSKQDGLGYCVDLGVFYLDQWRLDDADRFFAGLIDNRYQVKEYAILGKLGHAMVLAFKNETSASVDQLIQLLSETDPPQGRTFNAINRNTNFIQLFVKALDYDAVNCEALKIPFPSKLEALRKARPLPAKRAQPGPAKSPSQKA